MNKNKTLTIFLSSLFLVALFPSFVMAAWWNPLSWFNNWNFKKEKVEEVLIEKTEVESIKENSENKNDTEKDEVEILKKEIENLKKQGKSSDNSYTTTNNKSAQNLNIENNTTTNTTNSGTISVLKITNIQKKVKGGAVTVTWETNYPSESTLTLIQSVEKTYTSNNGLSKNHSITLYDLVAKNEYNFKITAITEDRKQEDIGYGLLYVIEQFSASFGQYDDKKGCQTIILRDTNGRLKNKQIAISARSPKISYGRIYKTTDSTGEVNYCENSTANEFTIGYLNYDTVSLKK